MNNEEDLARARQIINIRYPQYTQKTNEMLKTYDPVMIGQIQNSLRTETQRLKIADREDVQAHEKTMQANKLQGFSPGSQVYKGGKSQGTVPFKPEAGDWELFTNEAGDQSYHKKGATIPTGFTRVDKKSGPSVVVQTGDLGKSTKTSVEKNIIEGVKNIQSFGETKKLFKEEYLTYFGKGQNQVNLLMDKAGITGPEQKKMITERNKWFRGAKADFIAYRKWATGVAGGEKEMAEIATSFPDPVKNSPTQYAANLDSIEETTKRVLALNANFLKLGIDMDQPLTAIVKQMKAGGMDLEVPGVDEAAAASGPIVYVRDANGKPVRKQ